MGFSACAIENQKEYENEKVIMPLIDAHIHLYPEEVNLDPERWAVDREESHWAQLCTRRRKNGQPVQTFPSVDGLLRAMDAAGVARSVLQGWYWENPESCEMQNRFYAQCVKAHPDRLSGFATIHPGAGMAMMINELTRAHESGLVGLGELSPHSQGFSISDPVFTAAMTLAGKLGMPVNLHVTEPESRDYPGKVQTPLGDFVKLAQAHPSTTFILAHWGGRLPLVWDEELPTNIYYDTAASPLLYSETMWREFCAKVPAERVLFGSDYPLNVYPAASREPEMKRLITEMNDSGLSLSQLKAMASDNTTRLLKLPD